MYNGNLVACKVLLSFDRIAMKKFKDEATLHSAVKHEGVLECFGIVVDTSSPCIGESKASSHVSPRTMQRSPECQIHN